MENELQPPEIFLLPQQIIKALHLEKNVAGRRHATAKDRSSDVHNTSY